MSKRNRARTLYLELEATLSELYEQATRNNRMDDAGLWESALNSLANTGIEDMVGPLDLPDNYLFISVDTAARLNIDPAGWLNEGPHPDLDNLCYPEPGYAKLQIGAYLYHVPPAYMNEVKKKLEEDRQ
jgi:hypothetical protein